MKYNLDDFVKETDPLPGSLTTKKIIFINGPPRSGKDSLGNHLNATMDVEIVKMAAILKRSVYADFGLPLDLDIEAFDSIKNVPLPIFDGLSFRDACIEKSEERTKPWRGHRWFGKLLAKTLARSDKNHFAITDSGFVSEAEPVIEAVGIDNCLLLRVHAEERGKTFAGDSRSYIELPGVKTFDLENNTDGDAFPFFKEADALAREFLWGDTIGHFDA